MKRAIYLTADDRRLVRDCIDAVIAALGAKGLEDDKRATVLAKRYTADHLRDLRALFDEPLPPP